MVRATVVYLQLVETRYSRDSEFRFVQILAILLAVSSLLYAHAYLKGAIFTAGFFYFLRGELEAGLRNRASAGSATVASLYYGSKDC
jgi:hypothetical protein